jgi:hypothetical protein
MSWGEFKAASNEVGGWFWGMAQGGFNEKQSIGQIVTDAVISMFPIAGEVTAARDVIASSLRLAQYPEKRKETMEWVGLVLPLLAIVPLLGGALKGIGKLVLKAGKNIDEDKKILEACVWLLNKVGEGNALKFIRELDFTKYAKPIVDGAKEGIKRTSEGISYVQKKFGAVIPDKAIAHMNALKEGLEKVGALIDKMVPQALKDLNNKLKHIQSLAYQGEWHMIPGAGKAITRETEARLVHDALLGKELWKLESAKFPQNTKDMFTPHVGYPDLEKEFEMLDLVGGKQRKVHGVIAAFHGPITAKKLEPGTALYRVVTPDVWSKADGAWWTVVDPKTIKGAYWRVKFAVLQSWSANGKYVKYVVKDKPLFAWEGKVSSQIDQAKTLRGGAANPAYGQYLEGGETQLYLDLAFATNQHAKGEIAALTKLDTNWIDHMNIHIPERGASVQKLGKYVEEQKSLASANLASAANQAGHADRAVSNER